ncbi:MAG: hypothetical protein ACP5HS_03745 [Anaerolineae bacterium]
MIDRYLQDLERRIDPEVEEALFAAWVRFVDGESEGPIFSPHREDSAAPATDWPHVQINDALGSYELMALQQLEACSQALAEGSGAVLAVRCNYGTGIIPTLFGAELFLMDREIDTLPTVIPLGGLGTTNLNASLGKADETPAARAVKELLDRGVPDLRAGLGRRVFEMAETYQQLFAPYPKLRRYVHPYHPDLQGPMDICELLWGSSLFLALVEAEDLVLDLLELVTDTYVAFMEAWTKIVPFEPGPAVHWSMVHGGNIMLRDDSAMNLSPRMFDRFVKPFDERLLQTFGGGGLHFCGRGDHYIRSASEMAGLTTVNLSQPEYNDMDAIFDHTVDKGLNIIGLPRQAAEAALAAGRDLHGRVHCW